MTTAIVKKEITSDVWNMIEKMAPTMKDSRLFGVATAQQAAVIMLKGYELGLNMTASFEHIYVISDKPVLSPRGALALVLNSPEYAGMKIDDQTDDKGNPTACVVWMKRRNGLEYTAKFTMEDAKRADLIKSGSGWAKYPANMLRYRAMGYAIDIVFPDVTGGMKRADEFGAAVSPEGDVIAATWTEVKPAHKQTTQPVDMQQTQVKLQDLLSAFGPDKVLVACGNKLPTTEAEVQELTAKLNQELNDITVDGAEEMSA